MDPSPFLPKLTLSLLLFNTFFHFSFAYSKDDGNPDFLPTEGTKSHLPFVNTLNASFNSSYSGDSFSVRNNKDLVNLLDIGSLSRVNNKLLVWLDRSIPNLDGTSPGQNTWLRELYSMKFVAYDVRLGKLQTVDALGMSFTVELQIFLQWQEWMTNDTHKSEIAMNDTGDRSCKYICDSTRPMDNLCCDSVWVPTLRLPNADVSRMDSILSDGNLGMYAAINGQPNCIVNQTTGKYSGNASCYHQRYWELSVVATCDADMKFQYFPFDVQELSIDIRNPYSSRTWFQLASGSLQEGANNLVQKMQADPATLGWQITDLIVSPLCDVLSWNHTFLALDRYLFNGNQSQAKDIEDRLSNKSCPNLYNWSPRDSTSTTMNTSAYNSIKESYTERLNYTKIKYIECVNKSGVLYNGSSTNIIDFWINPSDPLFNNRVSLPCLVDAVKNLTTPGIKVTIQVKRYTEYYILKLVIPMIVCVGFAFTSIIIQVKEVANRLMVIVPAAISLTALQVTVVATDIPAVSYIVPSTWLMMLSYLIQLLISFESMILYRLGHPPSNPPGNPPDDPPKQKVHFKWAQLEWTTRRLDFLLMGMLFCLYIIILSLCMFIPFAKIHKTDLLPNGVSIWNANK